LLRVYPIVLLLLTNKPMNTGIVAQMMRTP
jgi:hypothetical protein